MKRYPPMAIIFEVISQKNSDGDLPIGTHVEGAGPCCVDTDRAWTCGVLVTNEQDEENSYQWISNLRPLTKAARDMAALFSS